MISGRQERDDQDEDMTLRVYAVAAMNAIAMGEAMRLNNTREPALTTAEIATQAWDMAKSMMRQEQAVMADVYAKRDADRAAEDAAKGGGLA